MSVATDIDALQLADALRQGRPSISVTTHTSQEDVVLETVLLTNSELAILANRMAIVIEG